MGNNNVMDNVIKIKIMKASEETKDNSANEDSVKG